MGNETYLDEGAVEQLVDVVYKLVGPVKPVGETNADNERYRNLKVLCALVEDLVTEIDGVAFMNKDRPEYSMQRTGKFAYDFLNNGLGIVE